MKEHEYKLESQDLRLGNWIKHAPHKHWVESIHNVPVQVDIDILQDVYFSDNVQGHPRYLPIELSPEILEKAGFKQNGFKDWIIDLPKTFSTSKRILSFSGDYLYLRIMDNKHRHEDEIVTLWNKDMMKVFYTHQLQNLYFSLCGSELSLNL